MKLHRIKAIIVQQFFHMRHDLGSVMDVFWYSSMSLIVWGFTSVYFQQLKGTAGQVVGLILGGMILWLIVWRTQHDISVGFLREVWSGNLLNLFSTPITTKEFLAGTIMASSLRIIFTLAAAIAIALFLYSFNLFDLGPALVPFFGLLLLFAWAAGLFITALLVRFGTRIQSLAWGLLAVIEPFSCIYYPPSTLPFWGQKIAFFLPTTHIFEGMRQILRGEGPGANFIFWAALLDVFYLILASLFFSFMFEKAREVGRLIKTEE